MTKPTNNMDAIELTADQLRYSGLISSLGSILAFVIAAIALMIVSALPAGLVHGLVSFVVAGFAAQGAIKGFVGWWMLNSADRQDAAGGERR